MNSRHHVAMSFCLVNRFYYLYYEEFYAIHHAIKLRESSSLYHPESRAAPLLGFILAKHIKHIGHDAMKNPLSTIIRELSSLYHLESRVAPLLGFILLAISNRGSSGCLNSPISGFSARSRHGMPSHEKKKHEQTTPSESLTKIQSQSGIEAAKSEYTLVEQAKRHDAHPNQITQWKVQLLEIISEFFSWSSATTSPSVDVKSLHAKIGGLILENYFLKGALTKAGSLSTKR